MVAFKPLLEEPSVETSVGNYFISNYPPFSTWSPERTPELEAVLGESSPQAPLSLYVHIPFCRSRCRYCYFRVHPGMQPQGLELYIAAVLEELSLYLRQPALRGRRLLSVYFGGGSPSYLSEPQIRRLLGGLQERLAWDGVVECTFEIEPATASEAKLRALKELGVTRVSLGFQSLSPRALAQSGRQAGPAQCLASFLQARKAGFREINIDLLAGLPGETEESWMDTVDTVAALAPECVTIYQLEMTYNSILYAGLRSGRVLELPRWSEKRRWTDRAFRRLEGEGYTIGSGYMAIRDPASWRFVYTVEHFWHGGDLLALGETAFGHFQGVHYQNADDLESYLLSVCRKELPVRRVRRLDEEEKLRREVVLQFKTGCLDAVYFQSKFGVDIREKFRDEFDALARRGLLRTNGDDIRLTREGLLQVDRLLPGFYLEEHQGVRYT